MTETVSQAASWIFDDRKSQVLLRANDMDTDPGALIIWDAQFASQSPSGFSAQLPSDDLADLRFSKFTLDVFLKIEGTGVKDLHISFIGRKGHHEFQNLLIISDHTVCDGIWFAFDASVLATKEILALQGITVPGRINLGQLVWLRGKDRLPIPVIDNAVIESFETDNNTTLPELNATLFPYQQTGIRFLSEVADESLGCILADEMGLGKTLQIIGLLALQKQAGRGTSLVVCPATLLENWRRELSKFAPAIKVCIHAGSQRVGRAATFTAFDTIITSYETAVRDIVLLSSMKWNAVILDEAQNIKNPEAQRTITVKSLDRSVSVAVTGTPVENRLTDLWSIADFVLPGLLGDKKTFESNFDNNETDAALLAPLVSPILLRRRVLDVATDLPPRLDIDQALTVSPEMAEEYENVRNDIITKYGRHGSLVAIGKLRQFCTHPRLLGLFENVPLENSPKYLRLLEILDEIFSMGEKVLIFTSYLEMSDIMVQDLKLRYRNVWVGAIDGRIEVASRQPMIDEFSEFEGPALFVLNPIAAGTGLNITAANHIIHYNPEWNPALEDQASARAYRRMQKRPVTIHHFFYVDTVEEVITDRLHQKRGVARQAVTGHEGEEETANIARALQISPLNRN